MIPERKLQGSLKNSLRSVARRTLRLLERPAGTGPQVTVPREAWRYITKKEYLSELPDALKGDVPQASIIDSSLQAFEDRDWREHFSRRLAGHGLEIGPLHRPMVRHSGMSVDYIDRFTVAELREHYPELSELPLVEPDIIGDAETLANVADRSYDFVIAAHVIEHMRNPISSINAWCRVTKKGGLLYLIVPEKRAIFDRRRLRTTLEHLILDYLEPSRERDYGHFLDYAVFVHDKSGRDALAEADRLEAADYSIHFHVFLPSDVVNLLQWMNENVTPLEIIEGPSMSPGADEFHLLVRVG